ncbi:hypothetical protein AAZX31_18G198900 [Glycine max]|uniref:Uncharacterized protein n=1 Tax=Glycine max TaxID=3847 RepID=I1N3C4_SOYBN|nr:uncharacterized protein LOC100819083 [Glycine max]KRH00520.1 hypothetical protein GLYMA_18G218000v4 [Glycine max]|eukprot:XP_003552334.1 uncharacterized protein LOC100819083 [Glycine max]
MAYRRRQGISRSSTFKEEFHDPSLEDVHVKDSNHDNASPSIFSSSSSTPASSLAAQAIKATASRHQPSLSFAFAPAESDHQRSKSFEAYGNGNSKSGFWGVIAQKAKSILDDDKPTPQHDTMPQTQTLKSHSFNTFSGPSAAQNSPSQFKPVYESLDSSRKMDNPKFRKGLDKITTSLNQLGDTFEKAFEEGRTIMESKKADLRTQIRRKGNNSGDTNLTSDMRNPLQEATQTQNQSSHETKLKASRDVAMATAAKAKLLLRELKSVKADLAFAKARCTQLEEENKVLRDREGSDKGQNREDDDLIRHQLETLLAEKARLASENETYSRENRFLREIVEYHQLTMQDVVYIDEGMGEVSEVYPVDDSGITRLLSVSPHSSDEDVLVSPSPPMLSKEIFTVPEEDSKSISEDDAPSAVSVSPHTK